MMTAVEGMLGVAVDYGSSGSLDIFCVEGSE